MHTILWTSTPLFMELQPKNNNYWKLPSLRACARERENIWCAPVINSIECCCYCAVANMIGVAAIESIHVWYFIFCFSHQPIDVWHSVLWYTCKCNKKLYWTCFKCIRQLSEHRETRNMLYISRGSKHKHSNTWKFHPSKMDACVCAHA